MKLGSQLKALLKIGDKVAGCVHGGWSKEEGSYAEYAVIDSNMCFIVPDRMKMEDAATYGVGWVTAAQVSYHLCSQEYGS